MHSLLIQFTIFCDLPKHKIYLLTLSSLFDSKFYYVRQILNIQLLLIFWANLLIHKTVNCIAESFFCNSGSQEVSNMWSKIQKVHELKNAKFKNAWITKIKCKTTIPYRCRNRKQRWVESYFFINYCTCKFKKLELVRLMNL